MTPTNDNATARLVAALRGHGSDLGTEQLCDEAADAITALQARVAEVEAERDHFERQFDIARKSRDEWRNDHDAALSREKEAKAENERLRHRQERILAWLEDSYRQIVRGENAIVQSSGGDPLDNGPQRVPDYE